MMRWLLAGTAIVLGAESVRAQSFAETALLFSRTGAGGSARIQGMGGAQVALGGDFSSAYSNPAGLGMYNRSEAALTLGYTVDQFTSGYLGNTTDAGYSNLALPGVSLVMNRSYPREKGLIRSSMAITLNRHTFFNSDIQYSGANPDNSLIDYFLGDAAGTDVSQFDTDGFNYNTPTGLGYFNYLIGPVTIYDPLGDPTEYFTDVLGIPQQQETIEVRGTQSQWNVSYAMNISDRFFVGGTMGIASIKYSTNKVYSEGFTNEPLDNFLLEEDLSIEGSGFNFTFGMIGRPVDAFQIGLSVVTRTNYDLTDEYNASMESQWKNFEYVPGTFLNSISAQTDQLVSDYILSTPWRVSVGAAWFFGKAGLITADAEFVDYSNAKYKPGTDGIGFDAENQDIQDFYASVVNLRVGGEMRFSDFRARAGYSYRPDPYRGQSGDRSISAATAGLGYRKKAFSADVAVVYQMTEGLYRPYTINSSQSPVVNLEKSDVSVLVTAAFSF